MSDPVEVPEQAILLAQATDIVRTELIESIRPALLVADGDTADRAKQAVGAVLRVLSMPGGMATAVAYVAGVRLDDELKQTVVATTPPLPPRSRWATLADSPFHQIDDLLLGSFTAIVAGCDANVAGSEHNTAMILADEAMYRIQSIRGRACVAYLCGLMAGAMLAESRGGGA